MTKHLIAIVGSLTFSLLFIYIEDKMNPIIMFPISIIVMYFTLRFVLFVFDLGKKDPSQMNDKEKEAFAFSQSLTGFWGGFFGAAAMVLTNLMSAFTKEKGYQNHPTLFRYTYYIVTLGFGIFRDSVVDNMLDSTVGNNGSDSKPEVCDYDD